MKSKKDLNLTVEELISNDHFRSYLTPIQISQYEKNGKLQSNTRDAVIRSLSKDYEVEWKPGNRREKGKFILDKREGTLPPFVLNDSFIKDKTEGQILTMKVFANYITDLKQKEQHAILRKTRNQWLIESEILSSGVSNINDSDTVKKIIKQTENSFYKHYKLLLNDHIKKFFFSQIKGKGMGIKWKNVYAVKRLVKNFDNQEKIIIDYLTDDEAKEVDTYKKELTDNKKYSFNFFNTTLLNQKGASLLKKFVQEKYSCEQYWIEMELNLSDIEIFQKFDLPKDWKRKIFADFRDYRTSELLKKEYNRPHYSIDENIKVMMIYNTYFDASNHSDTLLDIGDDKQSRISELRKQYKDNLDKKIVASFTNEILELYNEGGIDLDYLRLHHLAYYLKRETKETNDIRT